MLWGAVFPSCGMAAHSRWRTADMESGIDGTLKSLESRKEVKDIPGGCNGMRSVSRSETGHPQKNTYVDGRNDILNVSVETGWKLWHNCFKWVTFVCEMQIRWL